MSRHVFIIKEQLCQSFWQLVNAFRFEAEKIEGKFLEVSRVKGKVQLKRPELIHYFSTSHLPSTGTVRTLHKRLREHLNAIASATEYVEHVLIQHFLQKPSAICTASTDLLLCRIVERLIILSYSFGV